MSFGYTPSVGDDTSNITKESRKAEGETKRDSGVTSDQKKTNQSVKRNKNQWEHTETYLQMKLMPLMVNAKHAIKKVYLETDYA